VNAALAPWTVFSGDMNADGELTIRDLWLWLRYGFFLPGDTVIWFLSSYVPAAARFLEIDTRNYGGLFSGFASGVAWFALFVFIGVLHSKLLRLSLYLRLKTRALRGELLRRIRVIRNRRRGRLWL
jgi:hypothetical protein